MDEARCRGEFSAHTAVEKQQSCRSNVQCTLK
jgi:hypothetical protein